MCAYPAVCFVDRRVLIAYAAGGRGEGHLASSRIAFFNLDWLYH